MWVFKHVHATVLVQRSEGKLGELVLSRYVGRRNWTQDACLGAGTFIPWAISPGQSYLKRNPETVRCTHTHTKEFKKKNYCSIIEGIAKLKLALRPSQVHVKHILKGTALILQLVKYFASMRTEFISPEPMQIAGHTCNLNAVETESTCQSSTSMRPCLKQRGGRHLKTDSEGCPLNSTGTCTHEQHIHEQACVAGVFSRGPAKPRQSLNHL